MCTFGVLGLSCETPAAPKPHTTVDSKGFEVVTMVRRLAQKEHSAALQHLASCISVVVKFGAGTGEEPFAKVKDLITNVINKLQSEASCEDPVAKSEEIDHALDEQVAVRGQSRVPLR